MHEARSDVTPNVRVRFLGASAQAAAARFSLSAGTVAPSAASSGGRFHPEALVPRMPFRPATEAEAAALTVLASASGPEVVVFTPPPAAVAMLTDICEDCGYYAADAGAVLPVATHFAFQLALDALFEQLAPFRSDARPLDAYTLYRAEPGAQAVTRTDRDDPARAAHVGLHVDSWEGASLRSRDALRNRICVNLSRTRRGFLFVDLTLSEMMRALGLAESEDYAVTLFTGHAFLRRYPDYPVVRVALEAGEAYLAPTGQIVHDGVAPEPPSPDVALHLLGHFAVPEPRTTANR
jgi:hypothetical protein